MYDSLTDLVVGAAGVNLTERDSMRAFELARLGKFQLGRNFGGSHDEMPDNVCRRAGCLRYRYLHCHPQNPSYCWNQCQGFQ